MEKKISGVSPGKTYVIRFRPAGSDEWSKGYEFTAPRPTPSSLSAASSASGTSKNKISCRLQRGSGVIFNSVSSQAIPWNVVVSNDYGMWSTGTPTEVVAPIDGWYDIYTSVLWQNNGISTTAEYPQTSIQINGTIRFAVHSAVTNNTFIYIAPISPPPVYLEAGDVIKVFISPESLDLLAYGTYSVLPPTELYVTYIGP